MCFINPKFLRTFTLKVCTSHGEKEDFDKLVDAELDKLVKLEIKLNKSGKLRWCITEEQPLSHS